MGVYGTDRGFEDGSNLLRRETLAETIVKGCSKGADAQTLTAKLAGYTLSKNFISTVQQ